MKPNVKRKDPTWLKRLLSSVLSLKGKEIACGFPAGTQQAYPDGTGVAEVAAIHCYGMGVPQRDFMAYAQDQIVQDTKPILSLLGKAKTKEAQQKIMEAAGLAGAQAIKNAILAGDFVPNSASTVRAKKSDRPLVDTAHMLNSVTYVVRDKR